MFSVSFTKTQAEQFIKESLQKNFINVPEFIVRISDEESGVGINDGFSDESTSNSVDQEWITRDENDWFTHDPDWKSPNCPYYINLKKKVFVQLVDGWSDEYSDPEYPDYWDWSVTGASCDIVKWKYA